MLIRSGSQMDISPHLAQWFCQVILDHRGQLRWLNASQQHTCPGPPLKNSTLLGSYSLFSRQPLLLDAHSSFQGALKEVGSYLQLRGGDIGRWCSLLSRNWTILPPFWGLRAPSGARYCYIVGDHSCRGYQRLISHILRFESSLVLPWVWRIMSFWTPSSKLVALWNECQGWSNSNTPVLPRKRPSEVEKMRQWEFTETGGMEKMIKSYSVHWFPVFCVSLQWVWIAPASFLAVDANITAGSPFKIKTRKFEVCCELLF